MLTTLLHAARRVLLAVTLAVFFSTGAFSADSSLANLGHGFNELIYVLSRSVVTVEASMAIPVSSFPLTGNEAVQHNVSTGLICDSSGHILVAAPNVIDRDRIIVRFDNHEIPARVAGVDYRSGLAILETGRSFGSPVLFSGQQICAGQMVIMLGNAYGIRASPSVGFCAGARPDGTMQFTVPVTSGSIGGGVFDLSGHLLGTVIGSVDNQSQVAQAIPGYRLPGIVDSLKRQGDRFAGFMGITTVEIEIAPGIEVSSANTLVASESISSRVIDRGVVVTQVVRESAADRAGLMPGDLIFSFCDQRITTAPEFARQVIAARPGDLVSMELVRHNTYMEIQLRIDQKVLSPFSGNRQRNTRLDSDAYVADSLSMLVKGLKAHIKNLESQLSTIRR